jgi:hypothetical protein
LHFYSILFYKIVIENSYKSYSKVCYFFAVFSLDLFLSFWFGLPDWRGLFCGLHLVVLMVSLPELSNGSRY